MKEHLGIVTSDLGGVDGMGVVGVRQQINIEAKWSVAHRRDLILGRTSSVQEPEGGKLQLLKSVETQTLHKRSFNLTEGGQKATVKTRQEEGRKEGRLLLGTFLTCYSCI